MFRVTVMSGTPYAVEIGEETSDITADANNIRQLVSEGNPVIICEELEELEDFGIDPGDVQMANF